MQQVLRRVFLWILDYRPSMPFTFPFSSSRLSHITYIIGWESWNASQIPLPDQRPVLGFIQADTFLLSTAGHKIICHYRSLPFWIRAFQTHTRFIFTCDRIKRGRSPAVKGMLLDSKVFFLPFFRFSDEFLPMLSLWKAKRGKSRCPPTFQEPVKFVLWLRR